MSLLSVCNAVWSTRMCVWRSTTVWWLSEHHWASISPSTILRDGTNIFDRRTPDSVYRESSARLIIWSEDALATLSNCWGQFWRWKGVRLPQADQRDAGIWCMLRAVLQPPGARDAREHERRDPAMFPEGDRLRPVTNVAVTTVERKLNVRSRE